MKTDLDLNLLEAKHYNLIDDIMDEMDFDKIHEVMEFLNWEWAFLDDGAHVPELRDIRSKARSLMKECIAKCIAGNHRVYEISTAGFNVYYNRDVESLSLKFVVEEWDADGTA